jgi:hypothetical protein
MTKSPERQVNARSRQLEARARLVHLTLSRG